MHNTEVFSYILGVAYEIFTYYVLYLTYPYLAMHDTQEEELSTGQQHPVRTRILIGCDHGAAIFVPRDYWRGNTLGFTVQGRRVVFGDILVLWMLDDAWVGVLCNA